MIKDNIKQVINKPYLAFLPLLLGYIIVVLVLQKDGLVGDEKRYWGYAHSLLEGSFNYKDKLLWSGPGYPILLMPFAALDSKLLAKLLNAFILYYAIIICYKTLSYYVKKKVAFIASFILGLYYPIIIKMLPFMLTEPLTFLLIALISFYFAKIFKIEGSTRKNIIILAFLLGYLVMVKIIFAYVIKVMIIISIVAFFVTKAKLKQQWLQLTKIYILAFCLCIPYLIFSYSLTGKIFYWGNSGGLSLYWMSSPYKNDLGNWFYYDLNDNPQLIKNHGAFMAKIADLPPVEKDEALKQKAIENIKKRPVKYFYNWCANVGRLFFNYPYSYNRPSIRAFFYIIPNTFIFVFGFICMIPTILYQRKYPFEILVLFLFTAIYLGGMSLLSSYVRFFYIMLPIVTLWISFSLCSFIQILKPADKHSIGTG